MEINKTRVVVYVLFLAGLLLLLSLGGWQWRRGVEKAAVEAVLEDAVGGDYITFNHAPANWRRVAYRPVRLRGRWLGQKHFLLANRVHRGRAGHEVFTPFQLAGDGAVLLVNRGWVGADDEISDGVGDEVGGQLYLPEKGFTLGAAYVPPSTDQPPWPKVIQYFDAPALSAVLGVELQPAVVALDANHPGGFVRIWRGLAMTSTRHFGYAVQWWGLAATLLVFGVIWRRRA